MVNSDKIKVTSSGNGLYVVTIKNVFQSKERYRLDDIIYVWFKNKKWQNNSSLSIWCY